MWDSIKWTNIDIVVVQNEKKKKKNGREDVLKIIAKHVPNEYDNIHEYKDDEIHKL